MPARRLHQSAAQLGSVLLEHAAPAPCRAAVLAGSSAPSQRAPAACTCCDGDAHALGTERNSMRECCCLPLPLPGGTPSSSSSSSSRASDCSSSTSSDSSVAASSGGGGDTASRASSSSSPAHWHGRSSELTQSTAPLRAQHAGMPLHHKLLSPDRRRKTPSETKAAADERHAQAQRLRTALVEARRAKAGDETRKVEELAFINCLSNQGRMADLQQRLEEGGARRQEALTAIQVKQQGASASVREAAERRRQAHAERMALLAEKQRRKHEARVKLQEERQAAAAAREAAKGAAAAVARQRQAEQQAAAQALSCRINARLRQAAQRRLQHLELIRERALGGKDGTAAAGTQGRLSPALGSRAQQQQQVDSSSSSSSSLLKAGSSSLNAAAPCFCPAGAAGCSSSSRNSTAGTPGVACSSASALSRHARPPTPPGRLAAAAAAAGSSCSSSSSRSATPGGSRTGSPLPGSPAAAVLQTPAEALQQLRGNSQSVDEAGITAAGSCRTSVKGARRRMAKARRRLLEPQGAFREAPHVQQLCATPQARALAAAWAPHLALLNAQGLLQLEPCECDGCGSPTHSSSSSNSISRRSSSGAGSSSSSPQRLAQQACHTSSGAPGLQPQQLLLPAHAARKQALLVLVASVQSQLPQQQQLVCHLARQAGLLTLLCKELLASLHCGPDASAPSPHGSPLAAVHSRVVLDKLQQAQLAAVLRGLLELPDNLDFLLVSGRLLPAIAKAALAALGQVSSLEPDAPHEQEAAGRVSMLLAVLVAVLEHEAGSRQLQQMQDELCSYIVAAGMLGRVAQLLRLYDQPACEGGSPLPPHLRPVPPHVLQCLRLLRGLTAVRSPPLELLPGKRWPRVPPHAAAVMLDLQATAMAGVLSLLTAVLLAASPSVTLSQAACAALPPNFVEAASLVVGVLCNVCALDLTATQHMLASPVNRLETLHLLSYLLEYAGNRWPAAPPPCSQSDAAAAAAAQEPCAAAAMDHPITHLLNQVLLLLGYFALLHPGCNQAMLAWGRTSILQRLCSLPAEYASEVSLRSVAMPTLLSACYGSDRACEVVAQHTGGQGLRELLGYVEQQLREQQQAAGSRTGSRQPQDRPQPHSRQPQQQQQAQGGGMPAAHAPRSTSSNSQQFALARRFPLALLPDARDYLARIVGDGQAEASAAEWCRRA